jgi:hypothetical protein
MVARGEEPFRIMIERFARLIGGIVGCVQVDHVRMEVEYLETWPIEAKTLEGEIGCSRHDVDVIHVVDRDCKNVVRLPERPQSSDEWHVVAAVVLQAKSAVHRKQCRIGVQAVRPDTFGLGGKAERAFQHEPLRLAFCQRIRRCSVRGEKRLIAVTVAPKIGV